MPPMNRACLAVLAAVALATTACGGTPGAASGSTGGSTGCTPGQSVPCVGPGGCQSQQVCSPDGGSFGPCQCSGGTSGGSGGTPLDGGWDGGAPHQSGLICNEGWDCLSGVCIDGGCR